MASGIVKNIKEIGSSGDHLFGLKGGTSSGLLTLCYI
jgi:hypothetical protein